MNGTQCALRSIMDLKVHEPQTDTANRTVLKQANLNKFHWHKVGRQLISNTREISLGKEIQVQLPPCGVCQILQKQVNNKNRV